MGLFDPRSRSDDDLRRDVERGDIDAFRRTDSGGIQSYKTLENGDTYIKDVEPADNSKQHQQTDFIVHDGYISSIRSHRDDD